MNKFQSLMGLILLMAMPFSSCKKDNDSDSTIQGELMVAQDQTEANAISDDVQGTLQQFMAENASVFGRIAAGDTIVRSKGIDNCATVTIIKSQKKITVDFGTAGCLGPHGRLRKGKWLISYTDYWANPGAVISIQFENFMFTRPNQSLYISVDNSSSQTITTQSSEAGIMEFKREFNMKTTLPTGQIRTYLGTRYITWNSQNTPYRFDDVFTIKTTSNEYGTDRRGRAYEVTVLEPVVTNAECFLQKFFKPVRGKIRITKIGRAKTINFGDGNCGGTITVEVEGGKTYTINEGD